MQRHLDSRGKHAKAGSVAITAADELIRTAQHQSTYYFMVASERHHVKKKIPSEFTSPSIRRLVTDRR